MKALGMKATLLVALAALALSAAPAQASGVVEKPKSPGWTFEGFFGTFDRAALQRGLQVYQEVCAGCHGLEYIAFRTLTEIGLSQDQAKAFAAEAFANSGFSSFGRLLLQNLIRLL